MGEANFDPLKNVYSQPIYKNLVWLIMLWISVPTQNLRLFWD